MPLKCVSAWTCVVSSRGACDRVTTQKQKQEDCCHPIVVDLQKVLKQDSYKNVELHCHVKAFMTLVIGLIYTLMSASLLCNSAS